MATYTPTNKQGNAVQQNTGGVSIACAVWEIGSATLGTADVLQGPTLPAGSVVVGGSLAATDCDTGTTLTLSVGDAGTTATVARLLSASTIGQASGIAALARAGAHKYTAPTRIDVVPTAAAAGGVAGGTLALQVHYIVLEPTT
jgi:hypothetical protein